MTQAFAELGLSAPLVRALTAEEIVVPTEIQEKIIPCVLANKNIIGQSETGTGKTLAYLLPVIQKLDMANRGNQVIILTPTHELAIQVLRQVERLTQNSGLPLVAMAVIGNVNITRQIEKLKEKPHIIIGSAGRILELIQKKKIGAHMVKTIVMDEGDRLLDEQNLSAVAAVIKTTFKDRQLLLFSATISPETVEMAGDMMDGPEVIRITQRNSIVPGIEHLYFVAEQRDKIEVLRKLLLIINPAKALLFINKSDAIDVTVSKLRHHGFKVAGLHGSSIKNDRKKAMEDFQKGNVNGLVASDLAARGLDIGGITHIFNLDMPEDAEMYLHRVGRTGRAGQTGVAISLVTEKEIELISRYERIYKIKVTAKDMFKGKIIDAKKK